MLLAACRLGESSRLAPPIVLLTVEGLRADALGIERGGRKLTPNLDEFARRATWAGAAIASSSLSAPSLTSLLTGLGVWKHGTLLAQGELAPYLQTLPETLQEIGYESVGFHRAATGRERSGLAQGLKSWERLRGGAMEDVRVAQAVADLAPRRLLWIHFDLTGSGSYRRRDAFADRVAEKGLPRRLSKAWLQRSAEARTLSAADLRAVRAIYETNLAAFDAEIGALLNAIERSRQGPEAVVALAGVRGEALGENGDFGAGLSLDRALIEVPLALKLGGASASRRIATFSRPSLARLYATLVELAGGKPAPGVAVSLLRAAPAGALSELYRERSANHFSWVRGDNQMVWQTPLARFAEEPAATPAVRRQRQRQSARALLAQKPLHGERPAVVSLRQWAAGGGALAVESPLLAAEMRRELEGAFLHFLGEERPLEREGFDVR